MLLNTRQTYGLVAQLLHWATAILILTLLVLGVFMENLPDSTTQEVIEKSWYYSLHKTLGVTTLIVASMRILWAISQPHPLPLNAERKLENLVAQTIHWMLYGAIILMPLTGWLHHSSLDGFAPIWLPLPQDLPLVPKNPQLAEILGALHFFTAILLVTALGLHIAGALKHLIIDRDETLARMLPGFRVTISKALSEASHKAAPIILASLAFVAVLAAAIGVNRIDQGMDGAILTTSAPTNSPTPAWAVDHSKSQLGIAVVQSGQSVSGHFASWNAAINFDPDNLPGSQVEVVVQIASLSLGGVSARAISPDFLNAELHPTATFNAQNFVKTGEKTFEARGTLDLVGQSKPFIIPFELTIENDRAIMSGKATIQRLDYGIGAAGFSGDSTVGFDVDIGITVEADRVEA